MQWMLAPSLLSADISRLADQVRLIQDAGADVLHADIMDGHFVPNLTFGPVVVKAIKPHATRPIDCHLMLTRPQDYAEPFIEAGADWVSFHIEALPDPVPLAEKIRRAGARAGLALKPATPVADIKPFLDAFDFVLVMTVEPGFGGQRMLADCVAKCRELRELMGPDFDVEVDGGVNAETLADVARAGANIVVAGSAVFGAPDPAAAIKELQRLLRENSP